MMNPSQLKIKQLEYKINAERELLHAQKKFLITKIAEHKRKILISEVLFAGFAFGYLIGPSLRGKDKKNTPQPSALERIVKWSGAFTKLLLKFSLLRLA